MILLEGNLICIFHSLENHSSRLFPPPPLFFLLSSLFHFLVADRSSSRLALRRKEGGEEKKWALGEKIATRTLLDPRAQTEGRDKESSRANSSILKSLARPFANPSPFFPLTANLGSRGNLFARVNAPPSLPPSLPPRSQPRLNPRVQLGYYSSTRIVARSGMKIRTKGRGFLCHCHAS